MIVDQRPEHSTLDVLEKWFEAGAALSASCMVKDSENYPCADVMRGEKGAATRGVVSDADTVRE